MTKQFIDEFMVYAAIVIALWMIGFLVIAGHESDVQRERIECFKQTQNPRCFGDNP